MSQDKAKVSGSMKVIGLNDGEINSSAALIVDGNVVCGAPEERFNRIKKTKVFPKNALNYVLQDQGLTLKDIDFIAQAWNPGATWIKFNPMISSNRVRREDYFYSIPDHLFNFTHRQPKEWVKMEFGGALPPIYFVQHHRCHIANAFFLSPFEEAAFLTADWRGEIESLSKGFAKGNEITVLGIQEVPNSLGMFYATFTEMVGYQPDNDEWKVMALSAYPVDCEDYRKRILTTVTLLDDGGFELDTSYYQGTILEKPRLYTDKLYRLLEGDRYTGADRENWIIKVAKAMQLASEDIAVHVLNDLHRKTKAKNLVLAGGFFMNSVLNGKITARTPFESVYISYAPDDAGNGIGAALYVNHCILDRPRSTAYRSSSIGPQFSQEQVTDALKRRKIKFEIVVNAPQRVAQLLSEGNVVGLFQGRMEFGDRALGNRSILGDPRNASMKDKINAMIKYREGYRPFAPATIFERVHDIFDVDARYECNYMEKVVKVREDYRKNIPAVTHFDGSGRLQTVQRDHNPYFYAVISEFEKITGIPVVLNTSFNINAEPVVLSPDDAISTFFNSGLDYLMMEDVLVRKDS